MNYATFNNKFLFTIPLLLFGISLSAQENIIEEVFVTAIGFYGDARGGLRCGCRVSLPAP